jgi:hypothetical protein
VTYYSIINSRGSVDPDSVNSDIFRQFYIAAAVGCKYRQEPKACQNLANLCVLQLYDQTTQVC